MTTKEQQEYNALSERMKEVYSQIKSAHPDWNHKQLMFKIALYRNTDDRNDVMRGLGFDIANSENLSEDQKNELIKSVHGWLFSAREFTSRDMGLLFRVRNEYHISNSGLYYIANSFKARISSFLLSD